MFTLVGIELYKIFKKWRSYIGFIAITILIVIVELAIKMEGQRSINFMTRDLQQSFIFVGSLLNSYFVSYLILNSLAIHIPFLITLVTGDLLAGEATAGTYRLLVTRPISRFTIVTSKFLAGIFYTFLLILWLSIMSLGLGTIIFGTGELLVAGSNGIVILASHDKVHIESSGFAMLPRDGMYTSPLSFLKNEYTALYVKDEVLDGHNTSVIKIIPLNDKGDLILTTLWVDLSKEVIRKVESTTKINGTFTLVLNYGNNIKYPLPASMIFSFNSGQVNTPFDPDEGGSPGRKRKAPKIIEGKVFINYSGYIVNKGIPDRIFEKEKEKTNK